jgi:hypothetical protein
MNDAPPAPNATEMLSLDQVELIDEPVRLYPDSVLRRAAGGPIGECTLGGVRCSFRRASVRDLAELEQKLGKTLHEALKSGDRIDQFRIARFAVTPLNGAELPDDGAELPFADYPTVVSVLRFFSGPGTLVARRAGPSSKTMPAESNGPAAP